MTISSKDIHRWLSEGPSSVTEPDHTPPVSLASNDTMPDLTDPMIAAIAQAGLALASTLGLHLSTIVSGEVLGFSTILGIALGVWDATNRKHRNMRRAAEAEALAVMHGITNGLHPVDE